MIVSLGRAVDSFVEWLTCRSDTVLQQDQEPGSDGDVMPTPTAIQRRRGSCARWLSSSCHGGVECICLPPATRARLEIAVITTYQDKDNAPKKDRK